MARIRSIKPSFFTDTAIAALPLSARLTYIGLWTYVDDAGRGVDNAALIKAAIWPLDVEQTPVEVEEDLCRLSAVGLVCRWRASGEGLLHVVKWKHQRIDKPSESQFPACNRRGEDGEHSTKARRRLTAVVSSKDRDRDRDQGVRSAPRTVRSDDARPDVDRICTTLADAIEANGSKRPTITERWRTDARKLLDLDGHTEEQALAAIAWCQSDEFWRGVVLSMAKLRARYDQLRLAAARRPRTDDTLATLQRSLDRARTTPAPLKEITG